jgi:hypothetical protein
MRSEIASPEFQPLSRRHLEDGVGDPYIRDHIRKATVAADDNIEYPATF